ncbi:tRNA(Ile)-lysidine synthase OS=Streptomyces cyaneofuscatus OX=66883 GN=tilS PE=3 SV=1 [Streptomyces cyaneofuscatus]
MGPHPAVAAIRLAVRRVLHDVLTESHRDGGPGGPGGLDRPAEEAGRPAPAASRYAEAGAAGRPARPDRPALSDRPPLPDRPAAPLVLVACSGGADSMALASALAFEARKLDVRAGGITVDHNLQPGSGLRAAEVVTRLAAMDLDPVEAVAVHVGREGGPEAAARDARYAALDAAAERHGAAAVLLGHTRDDQAETVLLGLARGSGIRSLSGMAAAARSGRGRPALRAARYGQDAARTRRRRRSGRAVLLDLRVRLRRDVRRCRCLPGA